MKFTSVTALAASLTGTALIYAAGSASAATIIAPILGGPFSPTGFQLGTIAAVKLNALNTYDFTFTISGAGQVLTQIQASVIGPPAVSQPIEFDLFSGPPGSGAFLTTTAFVVGPSLSTFLMPGNYYLQVLPAYIAMNKELLTGGLDVAVPEPANWAMMLVGFGAIGGVIRAARRRVLAAS